MGIWILIEQIYNIINYILIVSTLFLCIELYLKDDLTAYMICHNVMISIDSFICELHDLLTVIVVFVWGMW